MATATVTSKWQMVLPQAVRQHMGVRVGDKIEFVIHDDGEVVVKPVVGHVQRLKGMLSKPGRAVSLEEMDKAIRQGAAKADHSAT